MPSVIFEMDWRQSNRRKRRRPESQEMGSRRRTAAEQEGRQERERGLQTEKS